MIPVYINRDQFQYDVHALVKAFFPEEEVKVFLFSEEKEERAQDRRIDIFFNAAEPIIHIGVYWPEEKRLQDESDVDCDAHKTENISAHQAVQKGDISYSEDVEKEGCDEDTDSNQNAGAAFISDASTNGTKSSQTTPKNALKQLLYRLLVRTTGRELPWGALTGIRPAKIAFHLLEQNTDDNTIKNYLKNVHYVSDSKADLSLQIAKNEKSVLGLYPYRSGYSLYAGIPFCPTRCGYCSFAAVPVKAYADRVEPYLAALKKELKETARLMYGKRLDTLYIGGGTPTALSAAQLDDLIFYIESVFDLKDLKEFTVEAGRPDSILDEPLKLRRLREHRVSRICVNPQTFVQKTLDIIGREHTVEQTIEAFELARSEGFDNINMDIIVGLPGEGIREMQTTADHLRRLNPDDLTIHSLAVKRGSILQARLSEAQEGIKSGRKSEGILKELNPVKSDALSLSENAQMMEIAEACAADLGLQPYYLYRQKNMTGNMENTGYARAGCFGLTNILGMEEIHSILAVGAGAVTKRVYTEEDASSQGLITRCGNVREIDQYIERVDEMIARKEKLFFGR